MPSDIPMMALPIPSSSASNCTLGEEVTSSQEATLSPDNQENMGLSHSAFDSLDCGNNKLTREERRRRRRATSKYRNAHACRERIRVQAFNTAFHDLRQLLPTLPPDKKMSKIEILKMAVCYISYLSHMLDDNM